VSLSFVGSDGTVLSSVDGDGSQFQLTPEGFNTGLARNSVPLSAYDGTGASFAHLYRTQPWVATTINKLTRQVARPPLKAYERDSQGQKKRLTDGRLYELLQRPALRRGPINLKQWMSFPTLLNGNGAIQKMRKEIAGPPTSFRSLDWRTLVPEFDRSTGEIDHWVCTQFGKTEFIPVDDIVHFAWEGPDGLLGVSPLRQLGVTLRIERAAQIWQEATFRNSVRPSGGITLPDGDLAKDKIYRAELASDLARLHAGGPNAGRPLVLPPGSEWQAFSANASEAALIEQRTVAREEIAAVFDIPPPVIGILDHATYSNMDTIFEKVLFGPVLGPWFTLFEETFGAQVLDDEPAFEGQWVEFDLSEVLRGDPVKQAMALKTQMQSGQLTINEVRDIQNKPRFDHPSCDLPMIPANNIAFVGGEDQTGDVAGQEVAAEIAKSLQRAGARAVRKAKAGQPAWDGDRFHRELAEDLEPYGDHTKTADAWALAAEAIVHETLSDPAALEEAFASLTMPLTLGAAS
jgi:HK97 family phage portal protein